MTIQCENLKQMLDVTYGLLCHGMGFRACATSFTITLTGSH
jgi:hypothetical protein